MTRREEAIFTNELVELLTGESESNIGDKEFFERLLYANNCIAKCLFEFKDVYDELKTKSTPTVKEGIPNIPYYVVSVGFKNDCVSLGFYSTLEKARARIVDYENDLNSMKAYENWDEFKHDYDKGLTVIIDYSLATEYLDS